MAKQDNMKRRIQSEAKAIRRVTNDDLVCKDCVLRYPDDVIFGNVSKCEQYPKSKPNEVLLGGKCDAYVEE